MTTFFPHQGSDSEVVMSNNVVDDARRSSISCVNNVSEFMISLPPCTTTRYVCVTHQPTLLPDPKFCPIPTESSLDSQSQSKDISCVPSAQLFAKSNNVTLRFSKEDIRKYQHELVEPGINGKNYIICAPTGCGKTLVAALIIESHFKSNGRNSKVLFIVKTQQLAHQQRDKLLEYISGIQIIDITGESDDPIYVALPQFDVVVCTSGKLRSELSSRKISITNCSLLVLDECHHTVGLDTYAEIMERYLVNKHESKAVPQVVGLTASPGAGPGQLPDLNKAIQHQYELCARTDATSGIKTVKENIAELRRFVPGASHKLSTLSRRNPTEEFIVILSDAMTCLEKMVGLWGPFDKSNGAYQKWVETQKKRAVSSGMPIQRDMISVLEYLKQYVLARMTYEDFEKENALDVLSQVPVYSEITDDVTCIERELEERHKVMYEKLSALPKQPNPLLLEVEQLLHEHFKSEPDSRAIFFVRLKAHTTYIIEWINSSSKLKNILNPSQIIGSTPNGFTKEEQIRVIEKFRSGELNLLASTSVLEEGLDVPDCNLVIRFQPLSNEIATVQALGRARAYNSVVHTVIQSDSMMKYNHLLNKEKIDFASQALLHLSASNIDQKILLEMQNEILIHREERLKSEQARANIWNTKDVMLHCKKCDNMICCATDVFKIGTSTFEPQYVLPSKNIFQEKMKISRRRETNRRSKYESQRTHKIACIKCGNELGSWGRWKNNREYPVLTCRSFKFSNTTTGAVELGQKWKLVPFEVQYLDDDD